MGRQHRVKSYLMTVKKRIGGRLRTVKVRVSGQLKRKPRKGRR